MCVCLFVFFRHLARLPNVTPRAGLNPQFHLWSRRSRCDVTSIDFRLWMEIFTPLIFDIFTITQVRLLGVFFFTILVFSYSTNLTHDQMLKLQPIGYQGSNPFCPYNIPVWKIYALLIKKTICQSQLRVCKVDTTWSNKWRRHTKADNAKKIN